MKWDTVQLMVYGENMDGVKVRSLNEELRILDTQSLENKSYLFVDVFIPDDIQSGNYNLIFSKNEFEKEVLFPLLNREIPAEEHKDLVMKM